MSVRLADGEVVDVPVPQLSPSIMADTRPFRTFRPFLGQKHYSGAYWSSTESAHVVYESRLELSRLIIADFDPTVSRIFAQPLQIRASVDGRPRRHIPDFLLVRGAEMTFVAVKPRDLLGVPKVAFTMAWVREAIETIGWRFEVAHEQPQPFFDNVRFLAGYRRAQSISADAVTRLRSIDLDGVSFGAAVRTAGGSEPLVRAALLHMLWTHEVDADLSQVLCSGTMLTSGAAI